MGLKARLDRLEGSRSSACPECGLAPVEGPVTFEIGEPLKRGEGPPQLEFCPACGQINGGAFTLDLGDAPVRSRPEEEDV
jgi:hypothetical protein